MLDEHGAPRTGEGEVPQWRFPAFAHLNVILMGFPLGVARRALDDFAELARTKTRGLTKRLRLADEPHVQAQLAAAEGGLEVRADIRIRRD